MVRKKRQIRPKTNFEGRWSQAELDNAIACGSAVDQAIIDSAERLVSRICTELDLYRPDFTTSSHERGESITMVARLIEWPFVQELQNVKVFDFIFAPVLFYAISLLIMLTLNNAEGFIIICILRDAILVEETQIFRKVLEKKRQFYKLLLHELHITFSFISSDAWISEVFFQNLNKWANHQAPTWTKVGFLFGPLFFVGCNSLAKLCFDLISDDRYDVFGDNDKAFDALRYTLSAVLGLLPVIPRIISFVVVIGEIKFTGMRFKKSLMKNKWKVLRNCLKDYIYDFIEVDPDYDLRLNKSYRSIHDIRTALLLKSVSKSGVSIDDRVKQLALALMFDNVPMRYYRRRGVENSQSLRGASMFWTSRCLISDSAFFGRMFPDQLTDRNAIGLSFMKSHEVLLFSRKLKKQDEASPDYEMSFPESVVNFILAKERLDSVLSTDTVGLLRTQLENQPRGTNRASLDRILLGLSVQDLLHLRNIPGQIEQYLGKCFLSALSRTTRVVQRDKLPQNAEEHPLFGKVIKEAKWCVESSPYQPGWAPGPSEEERSRKPEKLLPEKPVATTDAYIDLYALYYVVEVTKNPQPGDYGDLVSNNDFNDFFLRDSTRYASISGTLKPFLSKMANRNCVLVSWDEFYLRQLKNQFRLFDGTFCVASLVDVGTEDLKNGGMVLFWIKPLFDETKLTKPELLHYLVCQVATFFPENKREFLVCSEKIHGETALTAGKTEPVTSKSETPTSSPVTKEDEAFTPRVEKGVKPPGPQVMTFVEDITGAEERSSEEEEDIPPPLDFNYEYR